MTDRVQPLCVPCLRRVDLLRASVQGTCTDTVYCDLGHLTLSASGTGHFCTIPAVQVPESSTCDTDTTSRDIAGTNNTSQNHGTEVPLHKVLGFPSKQSGLYHAFRLQCEIFLSPFLCLSASWTTAENFTTIVENLIKHVATQGRSIDPTSAERLIKTLCRTVRTEVNASKAATLKRKRGRPPNGAVRKRPKPSQPPGSGNDVAPNCRDSVHPVLDAEVQVESLSSPPVTPVLPQTSGTNCEEDPSDLSGAHLVLDTEVQVASLSSPPVTPVLPQTSGTNCEEGRSDQSDTHLVLDAEVRVASLSSPPVTPASRANDVGINFLHSSPAALVSVDNGGPHRSASFTERLGPVGRTARGAQKPLRNASRRCPDRPFHMELRRQRAMGGKTKS